MTASNLAVGSSPRIPRPRWVIAGAVFWFALICASSSTVVTPTRFFNWISENALGTGGVFEAFAIFWGLSWFVIVKGWHAFEFAVVYWLLFQIISHMRRNRPATHRVVAWVLACLFAVFDEWRQTFIPERGGTWTDVGIDCLGASIPFLWGILSDSKPIPTAVPQPIAVEADFQSEAVR